ncbi:MAG TPA: hypothetical protein H9671_08070 [Firmicutes bacterium]|nr:hypothetical protein [Bacillota bacterium]
MKNPKRILHKLLFPGVVVVILSVPVGAGLLAYTFLVAGDNSPVAYVSYLVSAYSLTIVCTNLFPIVRKGNQWVYQNPYIRRYFEDIPFKLRISLYSSFVINLLYAGVNAFSGIYYRSPWFGSLAAYYIFLSVMRLLLVRYTHKHGFGENKLAEWRHYRLCGVILAMMTAALSGVVILVIRQNRGFEYAGFLIYIMAMYTFYITIMAVVNVVRYRKYNSPVMSAARVVNLVAALVSMLSLETAMLAQFDTENTSPYFRQIMTGITGGAVCVMVVGMGVYMVVRSTRQLKKL